MAPRSVDNGNDTDYQHDLDHAENDNTDGSPFEMLFHQSSRRVKRRDQEHQQQQKHRRSDSLNRSLWHRASRRLLAGTTETPAQAQAQPSPPAVSRKHSSLMASSHPEQQKQQQQQQQQQLQQQRRHQTWYYSSNHVLVNRERLAHGLLPMMRSVALDDKARQVAKWAAQGKDLNDDQFLMQIHHNYDGSNSTNNNLFESGNVLVGASIRQMHGQTLHRAACRRERNNLLNPDYHEFGMGTYKEPESGLLYLCQLFATGQQ